MFLLNRKSHLKNLNNNRKNFLKRKIKNTEFVKVIYKSMTLDKKVNYMMKIYSLY